MSKTIRVNFTAIMHDDFDEQAMKKALTATIAHRFDGDIVHFEDIIEEDLFEKKDKPRT